MSTESAAGGELTVGSYEPEILVFKGDQGASMILSSPAKEAPASVPQLPDATLSQVERGDEWLVYSNSLLDEAANNSDEWRRAFDGSNLWDLSLTEPADPVFYAAPKLFGGTWLNEDSFPEDVSLEGNYAVYRSGLDSPQLQTVTPTVEALNVNTHPGSTVLTWTATVGGEEITQAVDVTYWVKGSPSDTTTVSGQSGLSLELQPEVTYVADLFGTTIEFTTRPEPPDIIVYGQAAGPDSYEYIYVLENNNLDKWTDPFGTDHTSDKVTVSHPDAVSQHSLVLTWTSDEQGLTIDTTWRLPNEKVDVEATAETGLVIPTGKVPSPAFTQQQYAGTREIVLQNDVYGEGTWHLSPAGYLPQAMEGALEDYVDATFILPGGEEAGQTVELSRPTTLSIELSVQAKNGFSPVVHGAVRWKDTSPEG